MPKDTQQIIEKASNIVKRYVRFEDHSQYVAGDPALLKKDIIQALSTQESELKAQWRKEIEGMKKSWYSFSPEFRKANPNYKIGIREYNQALDDILEKL